MVPTKLSTIDISSLAAQLRPGQLLTHLFEMLTYEVDAALDRARPDGVVFPESAGDVALIVNWAAQNGVPLTARGAGTGLSGGAVAEHGGLIVEFSRMKRILEFDLAGRSVAAEPGVVNLHLDEFVRKAGLYYPPDPASGRSATLGGNIAENAGGPHCFKYGVTTNYLTGLEAVLADGKTMLFGGRALDYPEYDFVALLTGSEGTLGIVTKAYARLLRYPPAVKTMMAAFDTVEDAGQAVSAVIAGGLVPATLEMMDQKMMRIVEDYAHAGLPVQAGAALIVEVDGYPESLDSQAEAVMALLQAHRAWDLRVAQSAEERDLIWYGRKSAAGAMARLSPSYYLLDGTVPRSKLAETLAAISGICDSLGLRVAYVFHAGDGNLHPFILIEDPDDPALLMRVQDAGQHIMQICVGHDGSITGEHGVGIEKRRFMPLMFGPAELSAMRDVKDVFDPQGLMNPGKIFPPEEIVDRTHGESVDRVSVVSNFPGFQVSGFQDSAGEMSEMLPVSDVEAVHIFCQAAAEKRTVRLRGGGTKSCRLPAADWTLRTAALKGVRRFAVEDLYVTAGAGTCLMDLQSELASSGMWVPLVSPWEQSTLGGMLSANFNAPLRMRYGSLRDLLLEVKAVLPDGRCVRAGRPVVKNVAGYDLPRLFAGAYGTLGLVTEMTLKLAAQPRARASLLVSCQSLECGLAWGASLLQVCLNASTLALCKGCAELGESPYTLVYTVEGVREDVAAELGDARRLLEAGSAGEIRQVDALAGSDVWARWVQSGAPRPDRGEVRQPLLRLGVAPKDLPALLVATAKEIAPVSFFVDLASGLLYVPGESGLPALRQTALRLGGYAILLATPPAPGPLDEFDAWGYRPASLERMRQLKARWDPQSLLNPGAFLV